MQSAIYLFGFARGDFFPALEDVSPTEEVFQEKYRDITAIISPVPLDEFVGEHAEAKLQDISWMGPRVVRHGAVLESVMRSSPVFPVRFGTLFSSRGLMLGLLDHYHTEITEFLDYMADKEEWGVKARLSRAEAKERLLHEVSSGSLPDLDSLSPGVRYFKQKQLEAQLDKKLTEWLSSTLKGFENECGLISDDLCRRKIHSTFDTDKQVETVGNWAVLIRSEHYSRLTDLLEDANAAKAGYGLSFELSGPWPPYSFAPQLDAET